MKFFVEGANALAGWLGFLAPAVGKGFVILTLVFVVMLLWRRGTAAGRHLAWAVTFLCLLLLPFFARSLPVWHPPAWANSTSLGNNLPDSLKFFLGDFKPQKPGTPATVLEKPTGAPAMTKVSSPAVMVKPRVTQWCAIAAVIWLVGLAVGLARILAAQVQLHRMKREMRNCEAPKQLEILEQLRRDYRIKRHVRLLIGDESATPMTWGIWRPVIALPAESRAWLNERLRVVLRHELAHVWRWDCFAQELAHAVCALYWFNPLAWLAARRMRAEREMACDDFVLNAGAQPVEYANHLVEIARQFVSPANFGGAVAMARTSGLEQRVRVILDGRRNRNAVGKITAASVVLGIFLLGLLIGGCSNRHSPEKWSLKNSKVAPQLKSFVAEKEAQANAAIKAEGQPMPPLFKSFFAAAARGDWMTLSKDFENFRKHAPQYKHPGSTDNLLLRGTAWQAVIEIWGTFDSMAVGDEKYSVAYADDIIDSIPPGSIYFGGTDPGRFLITGMEKSQVNADPFFLLTQNALADGSYLDYLRSMYGDKIYIPTSQDSKKCFQDYVAGAKQRLQDHQLKPGEHVSVDAATGRVQVSGQVAVMSINGLLAKIIFDQNSNREFYIEESFPLDWMYPYLEPHGLIFKINRHPLPELSDEIVQRDHDYWTKLIQPMIGGWLNNDTSVQEIADFAKKVFQQHDFSGFTGDRQFVQNDYSCKIFSKERSSIAGLYAWRAQHAGSDAEKQRMQDAADFAYRQAWALCPYSPEVVFRYVSLLTSEHRFSNAQLVAETAAKMPEMKGRNGQQIRNLVRQLERNQR